MSTNVSAATTVVNAANKASTFANQTVETARFEALKEPLGFIKILQFFMAILAFAFAVNGTSSFRISIQCDKKDATSTASPGLRYFEGRFKYPYNLNKAPIVNYQTMPTCEVPVDPDYSTITNKKNNIVSSSQFFVFVGVMAFLYSLAFLIIYVLLKHKYDNIVFLPIIDFICTCLFTLCWFAGSIAWAKAITDIKTYTDPRHFLDTLTSACDNTGDCQMVDPSPTYANIVISCIIGFGNLILWSGDIWFVLKETAWYKTRRQLQQQQANMTNNPISSPSSNNTASTTATPSAQYIPNNFSKI